jgi:chromate reductase, NAD(P)H dehydrogenase (quinone)
MPTIIGISGSLRRGSYNSMLLAAAAEVIGDAGTIEIASIRDFPLYDGDLEAEQGIPASVTALKDRIANADGLLLASPEYNHSVPGVLKNAIDWLTRPNADIRRVFGGLPVAVMGATIGRGATILAQAAWLPIFQTLMTKPFTARSMQVAQAATLFDEQGLRDEATRARLTKFVREFAAFAHR